MPRREKKHHFIYKTTNIVNESFYIGMHSTDNLDDGYVGSGKRLWYSINKYGKENFKVEILEFFPDRLTLRNREREIVNSDLILDKLCLNIVLGGEGGFISIEGYKKGAKKRNDIIWNDPEFIKRSKIKSSNIFKELWKQGKLKQVDWNGRTHTTETKEKMSEKGKLRIGNLNSQFGTCWITNDIENKKIKKPDFHLYENIGWRLGRI